jgi:hypothetical protein
VRIRLIFVTILAVLLLSACSESKETIKVKEKSESTEEKTESATEEAKNGVEEKVTEPTGMNLYKPKVGVLKTFTVDGGSQTYSEEFVYETDKYIQKVTTIGQSVTVQVYKWTSEEISLVLEDREPVDPYANYLTTLNNPEAIDTYYFEGESDWELVESNKTVNVPSGEYTNVLVFKKITNEVEGADTIYVNYFAPELGLIIEEFELTGDQGYTAKSVLTSVEN